MSSKIKLYRLIGFFIVTFALLLCFSTLVDKGAAHSPDPEFVKVNKIMADHIDPDIIAFGSSVGERGFDSRIVAGLTGCSVYNSSIDGTNFEQYRGLIDEYAGYSDKKSTVIFFESYFSMVRMKAISSIERYSAYLGNPHIFDALDSIDGGLVWKARYIPLFKNTVVDHTYYKAALDGWENLLSRKKTDDSLMGYIPTYRSWEADQDAIMDTLRPFAVAIQSNVIADYTRTVRMLMHRGKQVIIVLPPFYTRLYKEKADFKPLRKVFAMVARETGCKFIDFSDSPLTLNKNYFYNSTHLNATGATVFSRQLADSLKTLIGERGLAGK